MDEAGRERERYKVPYGATIAAAEEQAVEAGQIVATWDPHTHPIITEVKGRLKFFDFVEGVTVNRETDEVTGLSSLVVTDPKTRGNGEHTRKGTGEKVAFKDLRPLVKLVGRRERQ
jgi:DNA-directed RNA polymerase subunit beta'